MKEIYSLWFLQMSSWKLFHLPGCGIWIYILYPPEFCLLFFSAFYLLHFSSFFLSLLLTTNYQLLTHFSFLTSRSSFLTPYLLPLTYFFCYNNDSIWEQGKQSVSAKTINLQTQLNVIRRDKCLSVFVNDNKTSRRKAQ